MRYLVYKNYESGFNNDLMSLELAVGLSWMTGRQLVLYGTEGAERQLHSCRGGRYDHIPECRRGIVDNRQRATVLDLVDDLPVPFLGFSEFEEISRGLDWKTAVCPTHLHESCFCSTDIPTDSAAGERLTQFSDGRSILVDPPEKILHLDRINFGYYSRFFFDPPPGFHRIMEAVEIAREYREFAARVALSLGDFGGLHVRLTDFRKFQPRQESEYREEILRSVRAIFDRKDLLLISTDESENLAFFSDLLNSFPRHVFLDRFIVQEHASDFRSLPFVDETAFGLICNLVLRYASGFAGTPGSSFTGMVHRSRLRRAMAVSGSTHACGAETFHFIGSGFDEAPVPFSGAAYVETREGLYSWNRIDLPFPTESKSWYREWPEAVVPVV